MARSPTHRFGQIIGEVLEGSLREPLEEIAGRHHLYLDYKHVRSARQGRIKVAWLDNKGNHHDLDYVLEAGGSEEIIGQPKAFIEIAYRRYTKHSRNKAQEIQGAIAPLFETYRDKHPFMGVVLGGVFTEASLAQLRSHGFGVLYLPFESIVRAFKRAGIDASFDEESSDSDVLRKVRAWERLKPEVQAIAARSLRDLHRSDFTSFFEKIETFLGRRISTVIVLALRGVSTEMADVDTAIEYIRSFKESQNESKFVRYEIIVRFSNGDEISGSFQSKADAVSFLGATRTVSRDSHSQEA